MPTVASILVNGIADATAGSAVVVEVTERLGQATGFSLRYPVDIGNGDLPLLTDDTFAPDSEISVVVSTAKASYCLVKGPVYGQQIHLEHGGTGSTLQVLGADSLIKLDREDKVVAWSDVADSD